LVFGGLQQRGLQQMHGIEICFIWMHLLHAMGLIKIMDIQSGALKINNNL